MGKNYFSIEHGNKYIDHIVIRDGNENVVFGNYFDMTYDEMKSQKDLDDFVIAVMEASNVVDSGNDQTVITLIDEDNIFIWSIIMGIVDGEIRYNLVNWQADGKKYRYEPLDK